MHPALSWKAGQCRFKQGVFTPTPELHSAHQVSHTAGTVYTATENMLSDCRVWSHQETQNEPILLYCSTSLRLKQPQIWEVKLLNRVINDSYHHKKIKSEYKSTN